MINKMVMWGCIKADCTNKKVAPMIYIMLSMLVGRPQAASTVSSFENPASGGCSQFLSSYFSFPSITWNV